jgi:hypothetical protein
MRNADFKNETKKNQPMGKPTGTLWIAEQKKI